MQRLPHVGAVWPVEEVMWRSKENAQPSSIPVREWERGDRKEAVSHKTPIGQGICLQMQHEQEQITHSHIHAKAERQGV